MGLSKPLPPLPLPLVVEAEKFRVNTKSRLPSFRMVDLATSVSMTLPSSLSHSHSHSALTKHQQQTLPLAPTWNPTAATSTLTSISTSQLLPNQSPQVHLLPSPTHHTRTHSTSTPSKSSESQQSRVRSQTINVFASSSTKVEVLERVQTSDATGKILVPALPSRRKAPPASNSRNDFGLVGPPPAMITQRSFPLESTNFTTTTTQTQDWVASIAQDQPPPPLTTTRSSRSSRSSTGSTQLRPLILPIRAFKPSTRRSLEMAAKRASETSNLMDPDSTIRALEGFEEHRPTNQQEHDEHHSDDSDLFLRAAREEEISQRASLQTDRFIRSDKRRSQIAQRSSLPPSSTIFHPSMTRRRGSDQEGSTVSQSRPLDEQEVIGQALTYRPSGRERPTALDDVNKGRYYAPNSRSNPTTPRTNTTREISPEAQVAYGGRRPSVPEQNNNSRNMSSYRQSNLSYSTPRNYNSSPLVARAPDMHVQESIETPQVATAGTASTVSTTAPSTLWDELDELKSRIHRLELTGKLPNSSGAAMSRASSERPPTATTTVTTMSSSPKRGRGNSISPTEATIPESPENHPLLRSALAKSQSLLDPEIYKALAAATSDALAISSMMGTSGQPGPLSSQSTVGALPAVSDRQVRRKADSMCRSLTELCLALSDGKSEPPQPQVQVVRPISRDADVRQSIEPNNNMRLGMSTDLARVKSSPRALSRLEARRSSLLTGNTIPSPRYTSESSTPTQSSMATRRTSLMLRSTRRGTEEPEEEDEARFRAPSRAVTDIGRIRNSPREYVSQQPLPERSMLPAVIQSALPVRRQYGLNNNTNPSSMPPLSSLGGRRYLDRATPERDTMSAVSRIAEDRAQRKSSIGLPTRTGSLTRKTRQANTHSADLSAGQNSGYQ